MRFNSERLLSNNVTVNARVYTAQSICTLSEIIRHDASFSHMRWESVKQIDCV